MFKKIWDFCGNIKVTFWLLLVISFNLAVGSYYIKYNPKLFAPLNHSLIQDWFIDYGRYQPQHIWWFGLLLALLLFLGINTIVCAIKRITQLWPKKDQLGLRVFLVKITPSFIHVCFLVMLAGHFLSLIIGSHLVIPVKAEQKTSLPWGIDLEVVQQGCERYQTPEALKGIVKQCTVVLRLQNAEKTEIKAMSVLNPIYWQGMSVHLDDSLYNRAQKTSLPPELKMIVKKDPGRPLILWGFAVLCLLLFWYFPQRKKA